MTDQPEKGKDFLTTLLDVQRAHTRTMKTMVQTLELHTQMLETLMVHLGVPKRAEGGVR